MLRKILIAFLFITFFSYSQSFVIEKVEPPNWWTGMKLDTIQLMLTGKNLSDVEVYPAHGPMTVLDMHKAESANYLFLDLLIDEDASAPYNFLIGFSDGKTDTVIEYPILPRENKDDHFKGFDKNDVIYLVMTDRFCDGNPDNNTIYDSLDEFTSKDIDGRKGGDIAGVISKLDYLKDLGITTIWLTPVLENNMWMSYHGYAATNLYRVDPRFGSNGLYKEFVEEAHKRDLKVILDHVSNHIGINHPWIKDLPFRDWINGTTEKHLGANHNKMTFPDPYSPGESVALTWEGWFTDYMPDLNQRNPYLKNYLIQNTIWWIEYSGVDGLREDTYPYVNQYYLSDWAKVIINEYPHFNIVGEIWTGEPTFLAAYQGNNKLGLKLNSNLPAVTDFALRDAFKDFLSGEKNLSAVFNLLAQDFIYSNPENLVTFIDNHDIERGMFLAKGDYEKFNLALTLLLTTRGIPKILYGTEIGITGDEKHGNIRTPFPGGFKKDNRNAFTEEGRSKIENNIYEHLSKLLSLRKEYKALSAGKLIHYYPFNNIYFYIKEGKDENILCIINGNESDTECDLSILAKRLDSYSTLVNLFSDESISVPADYKIKLNKKSSNLFLLKR